MATTCADLAQGCSLAVGSRPPGDQAAAKFGPLPVKSCHVLPFLLSLPNAKNAFFFFLHICFLLFCFFFGLLAGRGRIPWLWAPRWRPARSPPAGARPGLGLAFGLSSALLDPEENSSESLLRIAAGRVGALGSLGYEISGSRFDGHPAVHLAQGQARQAKTRHSANS